jgi:hypothetical protein
MPRTIDATQRSRGKLAGKRYPLNMRTTKQTRDALEAAAHKSGRSLAQEIEFRLEQSFHAEREFGGADSYQFFKLLASMVGMIEARTGQDWSEHYETFTAVRNCLTAVIQAAGPKPSGKSLELMERLRAGLPAENADKIEEARAHFKEYEDVGRTVLRELFPKSGI